jgi:Transketolase, pyrimidine binding domain
MIRCLSWVKRSRNIMERESSPLALRNGTGQVIGLRLICYSTYSYKITKGLLDRFGDKRVIDSPITESGFCGLTVGAALAGLHPVVSKFPA